MALEKPLGTTALARLRARFDATDLTCRECGYEDTTGSWNATTDGQRVTFSHRCPSCDADHRYVVRMGR
jgi:RNase P subunit RPR2